MDKKEHAYRPGHGGYVSEFSKFLNGYLDQHPEVREDQRRGWYIFWDHNFDASTLDRSRNDEVKVRGYNYD